MVGGCGGWVHGGWVRHVRVCIDCCTREGLAQLQRLFIIQGSIARLDDVMSHPPDSK